MISVYQRYLIIYFNLFILMNFQSLKASKSFLVKNDPSIKKLSSNTQKTPATKKPEEDQKVITYPDFDKDNNFILVSEVINKFVPGIHEASEPNPHESVRQLLVSPRVFWQGYFSDKQFKAGQRYIIGLDKKGAKKWVFEQNIYNGPDTQEEYRHLQFSSKDGIGIKSMRGKGYILIIDPQHGKTLIKKVIDTKINDIYSSFLTYNKDTQCLYSQTSRTNTKYVRLVEWNLKTGKEKELAQLKNQMLTRVRPLIDQMVIHKEKNYLLMVMEWPSRLSGKCAFVIYDLNQSEFIYKEYVYRWGRPKIIIGKNNLIGVSYRNQKGESIMNTYKLGKREE